MILSLYCSHCLRSTHSDHKIFKCLTPLSARLSRNLNCAYKAKVKDAKFTEIISLSIYLQDTRIALFIDESTTIKIYSTYPNVTFEFKHKSKVKICSWTQFSSGELICNQCDYCISFYSIGEKNLVETRLIFYLGQKIINDILELQTDIVLICSQMGNVEIWNLHPSVEVITRLDVIRAPISLLKIRNTNKVMVLTPNCIEVYKLSTYQKETSIFISFTVGLYKMSQINETQLLVCSLKSVFVININSYNIEKVFYHDSQSLIETLLYNSEIIVFNIQAKSVIASLWKLDRNELKEYYLDKKINHCHVLKTKASEFIMICDDTFITYSLTDLN